MFDFLIGLAAGLVLLRNDGKNGAEGLYEKTQRQMLIDIVNTAAEIEESGPSPEELKLQLKPLKMMFDRIDLEGIKSPEGRKMYHQVRDCFIEAGVD